MATKKRRKIAMGSFKSITCAFCKGTGKDPFEVPSKLSNCQVCIGRGTVQVVEPIEICPYCKGSGIFYHHRMPCSVCGGKGSVTKVKGEKRCEKCQGNGKDLESGLPCTSCYGLGAI